MTKDLGRMVMLDKGEFSETTQYEKLDIVTYNDSTYLAYYDGTIPVGTLPTSTAYFRLLFSASGGGGSANLVEITQAEYNALTDEEKHDTTKAYFVKDGQGGGGGGGGSVDIINDLVHTDTDKALSANMGKVLNDKIEDFFEEERNWRRSLASALRSKGVDASASEEMENLIQKVLYIKQNLIFGYEVMEYGTVEEEN